MKTRPWFAAGLAVLALAVPLSAPAAEDPVVARVNGHEFRKSDVDRELASLPPRLQSMPLASIYPQLLERMIDAYLVAEQGRAEKLDQTRDYRNRVARAKERILTDITLRARIKPQVTEAKAKKRYDEVVGKQKGEEEVRARHILVKTEKEAKDLIAQIRKGGDFAKLAAEKSTDKGSAAQGGDLGYFAKGAMVPAFAKAAFAAKKNEVVAKPVKTEFGWHVIKVEDRRKAKPVPFERVEGQIKAQIADDLANKYVEGLKKKAKIERFGLDGKPMKKAAPRSIKVPPPEKK